MDAIRETIWHKLRYTPLRDALRGQITGRMDVRRLVESCDLPLEVKEVLHRVVRKTHLWRLEQVQVAQELLAHFRDGIAAGTTPDELIRKFGDEAQAAKLIRRGTRRNRPMPWQVARFTGWSMATLLLFYFGFAIYFLSGHPSPRINYVAQIDGAIEKTPVEDRAWPLYRRALLGLGPVMDTNGQPGFDFRRTKWTSLSKFVGDHQTELEWIRQDATKPTFGFLIGPNGSAYDPELWPNLQPRRIDAASLQDIRTAALPPLNALRRMALLLQADAVLARESHDARRFSRDIDSLLGLSRQVGDHAPLLCEMISMAIYEIALDSIEDTVRHDAALLPPSEWKMLARRLSEPKVAGDLITLEMERVWFDDMLQRSFTDNGFGNGRLTAGGASYFDTHNGPHQEWRLFTIRPVLGLFAPSREKFAQQYTQLIDKASANLRLPMRNADWRDIHSQIEESRKSLPRPVRPISIASFVPDFQFVQKRVERTLGHRDGIVVGIALETYHREHGNYPENLNALVPNLLGEVPADRITGERVRYRVVDGQPRVYSVGSDRKDDEGRAGPEVWEIWDTSAANAPRGDWIIYPTTK